MPNRLTILQTCLPDYGVPLFERVVSAIPGSKIVCGRDYFTSGLALHTEPSAWRVDGRNRFLYGRRLLWQSGVFADTLSADVLIAEFNPRILSTWLIMLVRRLRRQPTLLWGHLWGHRAPPWLARYVRLAMIALGNGTICYSRSQAAELRRVLPRRPVWAAPNSSVTRATCEATTIHGGAGCVVYVGRLIEAKKPKILLEAFARAAERLPADVKLLLVGDGSERAALQRRATELGLADRVEMPGHVAAELELRRIYERSLVAVSPGYVGLSAIQCMSFGVPMIVSRDEPHSPEIEACVDEKTAAFFATDDVEDLARTIVAFFQAGSTWRSKRPEIADFIRQHYTLEGMVETFVTAFESFQPPSRPVKGPLGVLSPPSLSTPRRGRVIVAAALAVVITSALPLLARTLARNLANVRALRQLPSAGGQVLCWAWRAGDVGPLGHASTGPGLQTPLAPLWNGCAAHARGDDVAAAREWRLVGGQTLFMTRALAAFGRADYRTALHFYELAALADPVSAQAWLGVSAAQMNLASAGQAAWTDMLRSSERALSLAPEDAEAHYFAGYGLWLSGGDARRAESELRWAVEHRGAWGESYSLARMLLDSGRVGEPTRLLERALTQVGHDEVRAQLVRAYLAEGRCNDARVAYHQALTNNANQRGRLQQICDRYPGCSCE